MKQILIVEDDEKLNAGICYHLEKSGYDAVSVFTYTDAKLKPIT